MSKLTNKPGPGERIIVEGLSTDPLQKYLDEIELKINQRLLGASVILPEYTVATVPTASNNNNGAIIVSDETGG